MERNCWEGQDSTRVVAPARRRREDMYMSCSILPRRGILERERYQTSVKCSYNVYVVNVDLAGSSCCLIWSNVVAFAWTDWWKREKPVVLIVGVPAGVRTKHSIIQTNLVGFRARWYLCGASMVPIVFQINSFYLYIRACERGAPCRGSSP